MIVPHKGFLELRFTYNQEKPPYCLCHIRVDVKASLSTEKLLILEDKITKLWDKTCFDIIARENLSTFRLQVSCVPVNTIFYALPDPTVLKISQLLSALGLECPPEFPHEYGKKKLHDFYFYKLSTMPAIVKPASLAKQLGMKENEVQEPTECVIPLKAKMSEHTKLSAFEAKILTPRPPTAKPLTEGKVRMVSFQIPNETPTLPPIEHPTPSPPLLRKKTKSAGSARRKPRSN